MDKKNEKISPLPEKLAFFIENFSVLHRLVFILHRAFKKKEDLMTNAIAKRQNGNVNAGFGSVIDNIFQNSLRRFFDDNFWETGLSSGASVPVNVRETAGQYEMDVIAPGCSKEDFRIAIEDNVLTVSLDHKKENKKEDEKAGWVRNEYLRRSFSRSFTLDDTVDTNNISAAYTDGILRLALPKNEKAKKPSRQVEIK